VITSSELAGFFAAHAIWSVSDGDTLIPMLAYTNENDERQVERLAHDELAAAVQAGKQKLASNEMDANDAALIYEGFVTIDDEQLDSIIVEFRAYVSPDSEAVLAVPYTPSSSGRFRVHKPKLIAWNNCDDFDLDTALQSFFNGVAAHEKGAAIWEQALDESK
jgi:hypothetical protein